MAGASGRGPGGKCMLFTSRIRYLAAAAFLATLLGSLTMVNRHTAQAAEVEILVTSAGDSVAAGQSECPSTTLCTLRRAIEAANTAAGDDTVIIRFDDDVFDPQTPGTIGVADTPLPAITRANVSLDGRGAGVIVDGTDLAVLAGADGISVQADGFSMFAITIKVFPDICVSVEGDDAVVGGSRGAGLGNRVDRCGKGIVTSGEGITIQGNLVGLSPLPDAEPMTAGIEATDGDALAGVDVAGDEGNVIGNADNAIVFRAATGQTMTGVIRGNIVGITPVSVAAPVTIGIRIVAAAHSVTVTGNRITHAEIGISIPEAAALPSTRNPLRGNTFEEIETLAIDLGEDGRTVNSTGTPANDGANELQSYPEFNRTIQAEITGTVPGLCVGCTVDLYLADRRLDGRPDIPLRPIESGSTITNSAGEFSFASAVVVAGQWVMAIATDAEGNTSEFSDAVRIGAGVVQCGNVTLRPGWNASAFFGAPTALGATFPSGTSAPGPVTSIHQLNAGTRDFDSWFANGAGFGSLTSLSTGEPYWFYATSAVELAGSFTLVEPLPVSLEEGWNDFVYIGGEDVVLSALESLDGEWSALYRWVNDSSFVGWEAYGGPDTPEWARGFESMTPCAAYLIFMTGDGTLTPPQP